MEIKGKVVQLLQLQTGMGKKVNGRNRSLLLKRLDSIPKKYVSQPGVIR